MDKKIFTKNDDSFICDICGKKVSKLVYSSRDHCPFCLCSKHVDINPGDRLETCHGVLKPISIEKGKKDTIKIIYKCQKCGTIRKNIMADDDDFEKILQVMKDASI